MNNRSATGSFKNLAMFVVGLSFISLPWFPLNQPASAVTGCTSGSASESSTGNVRIWTFIAPASGDGSCTFTVPENVFVVDYLVLAGGGGGGSGGGGGGGVVTSWGSSDANPLTVEPGTDISVTIGAGGSGGAGGNDRYSGAVGTAHQTVPGSGRDSVFGSVTAIGGGAGGHRQLSNASVANGGVGVTGGSSGGDSYDRNSQTGASAATSAVVGAVSYGSAGGGSLGGSYSAGGGGGGAGGVGGGSRTLASGCGAEGCTSWRHGGGHGGAGVSIDITGSAVTYGCGGGGGVNSNSNTAITNGGGDAGCSTAGSGSRWGNLNTNYNTSTASQNAMATAGAANFGGGGGGTDPEDFRGAAGGSGVVIVRYTLVDSNCPNDDGSNSVSSPLACPTELTLTADGSSNSVTVMGSPVSFTGAGATMTVRSAPRANPTSGNLSWSVSGNNIVMSVPSGSSLVGGTYPVVYRITQNSITSDSYVLVTVEDPGQLTPGTVPLDPRDGGIVLPRIELGASPNVRLCLTLDTNTDGLSLAAATTSGVTITNPISGRLVLVGTNANVENAVNNISITAASGATLVPSGNSRTLNVNVSNTNNGGNGSCTFGTSSTIDLRELSFSTAQHLRIDLD